MSKTFFFLFFVAHHFVFWAEVLNAPNYLCKEFNNMIKRGQLPSGAKIGGLIEIHGDGGKGGNWTEGCVALKNSDMDVLYKFVESGTPVTIIGSTLPLDQYVSSR